MRAAPTFGLTLPGGCGLRYIAQATPGVTWDNKTGRATTLRSMSRFHEFSGKVAKPAFAVGACWIAASHFRLGDLASGSDAAPSTSGRSQVCRPANFRVGHLLALACWRRCCLSNAASTGVCL